MGKSFKVPNSDADWLNAASIRREKQRNCDHAQTRVWTDHVGKRSFNVESCVDCDKELDRRDVTPYDPVRSPAFFIR